METYAMAIEKYFAEGKKVVVCIWNRSQRIPADNYIAVAKGRFPDGDAIIRLTRDANLRSGQTLKGRTVVRYGSK